MCAAVFSIAIALGCAPAASAAIAHRADAPAAASALQITAQPALQPAFSPNVPNYAVRCEPSEKVALNVTDGGGSPVSVDRQPVQHGSFRTSLRMGAGQSFSVVAGSGSSRSTYTVRCLPANFPGYTAQVSGRPQAAYYLVTPTAATVNGAPAAPYVVLFDSNGVPVWWYEDSTGTPVNANLLANGNLSWYEEKNLLGSHAPPALSYEISTGFGVPGEYELVQHRLDGTTVGTPLVTAGSPTDFHEGLQLANGDTLMTSYVPRQNANLSPVFFGLGTAIDASFQEIRPDGSVAFSWNAAGKVGPAESARWPLALDLDYPNITGLVWDYQHIDSVVPDGNDFLVSLAHTDALYLVNGSTGAIEWKLGGTATPQSLRIIGDPSATTDFGGQSDARVWPDGTVSLLDNGINRKRPLRVLRFRIDPQARTATLVQTFTDPTPVTSSCCGSARLLPGGDWVVSWGSTPDIDELTATGQPVMSLTLAAPYFTYRAVPILSNQLRPAALQAAMNKMNPRTPSGNRPPALTKLRASYGKRGLRVGFTLPWRASVRVTVASAAVGRTVGWRCLPVAHGRPQHPCTRFVSVGASVRVTGRGGANSVNLGGRIAARRHSAGTYRVTATPLVDGRAGDSVSARFVVGR